MKIAPLSFDEELRIKDLQSYSILDSEKEKDYDDLVDLASQICDCPIALITFIDKERQWFKASKKMKENETSRDVAFCSHTILQNEVMIVKDAQSDERFYDNPLVTGELQIGFYAGTPIYSSSGFKIGSVCVIDNVKKDELSDKQKSALKIIASQVSKLLELRVKNKLIIQQKGEQIEAEKRIAQLILSESDKKDNFVAYELHENLAQTLAAAKLLLESAENSQNNQPYFILKSKEAISSIIDEMKILSKSIIPTTFEKADYYWIIYEYAIQFCQKNNIDITFDEHNIGKINNAAVGLNLFRIVQHRLEISKLCEAKKVYISIQSAKEISLDFRDDIENKQQDFHLTLLLNKITTRVELGKGEFDKKNNPTSNSLFIKLPLLIE